MNDHKTMNPAQDVSCTLRALADKLRRSTVRYFVEGDVDSATYEELIEHLNSVGYRHDPDQLRSALHHSHLPQLADADLVEYDARSQLVRYRGDEIAEDVLDALVEE